MTDIQDTPKEGTTNSAYDSLQANISKSSNVNIIRAEERAIATALTNGSISENEADKLQELIDKKRKY